MGTAGRLWVSAFVAVVLVAVLLAVRSATAGDDGTAGSTAVDVLVVAAASSLTDVAGDLETTFERANPDIDVVLDLAGSATLAEQVRGGAPIDVIATADEPTIELLQQDSLLDDPPRSLATNTLRLVVPAGNPAAVVGLETLADTSLFVGLCAAGQPCGDYGRAALMAAGLDPDAVVDTDEPDVRALLAKVAQGELDAGLVYATDVIAAGDRVEGIAIGGPTATYPIAVLRGAPNAAAADAFVRLATGPQGRAILTARGFGVAP